MPTLEWIGKEKVVNHHQEVPFRILDKKYTFNAENSENMIIHGDNLLALKSLLPQYEGLIDCIYIDPPYNTGEEKWVYNDNVNDPRIKKWLGEVVGKEGEDLSRHDKWLCMMYPRLKLLQKLLSRDGVAFISIGVDEVDTLKLLCNEIFGPSNFLGMVVRRAKTTSFRGNYFAPRVDYILIYAKNKGLVKKFRDNVDESQYTKVETSGPRKGELYGDDTAFYLSTLETRPNQRYYIECPDGELVVPPGETFPILNADGEKAVPINGDGVWRWELEQYKLKKDYLSFKRTKNSPLLNQNGEKAKWNIYTKIYLKDKLNDANIPTELLLEFINRQGTKELELLGLEFDFPKPSTLIAQLIKYLDRKNDITIVRTIIEDKISKDSILDSFSAAIGVELTPKNTDREKGKKILVTPKKHTPILPDKKQYEGYYFDSANYNTILQTIREHLISTEILPKPIQKLSDEELIRDTILWALNANYIIATGETFRAAGKTDINVNFNNRAAFIGECKVWNGPSTFSEAITQLYGYSTWRECRVAILIFNLHNKDFGTLLSKLNTEITTHKNYVSSTKKAENEWECKFKKETDSNSFLTINIIASDYCPRKE